MFTGIVEEVGRLASRADGRLRFECELVSEGARLGDSVAVNGCCLTVVERGPGWWGAQAVGETLSRTNLGELRPRDRVNLERPVRALDRLGGHLVQGHVDAVGRVVRPAPDMVVSAPPGLLRYVAEKGSIAVDGVSLTVVSVDGDGFSVAVIPHTAEATTLGEKGAGDRVNLEVDVIAKYTERLLQAAGVLPGGEA
jgi:riboflavin synthase